MRLDKPIDREAVLVVLGALLCFWLAVLCLAVIVIGLPAPVGG